MESSLAGVAGMQEAGFGGQGGCAGHAVGAPPAQHKTPVTTTWQSQIKAIFSILRLTTGVDGFSPKKAPLWVYLQMQDISCSGT